MEIEALITEILKENGELSTDEVFEKNNGEYSRRAISNHLRRMTEQRKLNRKGVPTGAPNETYHYSINENGAK